MQYPLRKEEFWISQGFSASHQAIDLAANNGTKILSPDTGIVISVNNNPNGYFGGNFIKVKGISGYTFYMGHNSKNYFNSGDAVSQGQHIADVGMTGQATGPHIHFEMSKEGKMYDPSKILKDYPGEEIYMIPDNDDYYRFYGQRLAMQLRNRELTREEFRKNIAGLTELRGVEILSYDPEADLAQVYQATGTVAVKDHWDKQIFDLENSNNQKDIKIKDLEKQLAEKPTGGGYTDEDRETAQETNAIVKWIKDLLDKVFK